MDSYDLLHKRMFVVDTENFNRLKVLEEYYLNDEDTVVLMYSDNSKNVSINDLNFLYLSGCFIVFEKVQVGFNHALDFQLMIYVTNIVTLYPNDNLEIYILSSDKCYPKVVKYLKTLQQGNYKIKFIQEQK